LKEKVGCQDGKPAEKAEGTGERTGVRDGFGGECVPWDKNEHGNDPKNRQGGKHTVDAVQGVILKIIDAGIKNTHKIDDAQSNGNYRQRERGKGVYFDLLRGGILIHLQKSLSYIVVG
jgi:hypothetical protein